jgi:glucose-6-phosphate isomerase
VISLAYGRMLQDGLDRAHGLPRGRLDELAARFGGVQAEVRRRRAAGEYGFYKLVDQGETVREIASFAQGLGQAYDHVLVLGIGGSALGARALLAALRRPAWNERDASSFRGSPCSTTSIRRPSGRHWRASIPVACW